MPERRGAAAKGKGRNQMDQTACLGMLPKRACGKHEQDKGCFRQQNRLMLGVLADHAGKRDEHKRGKRRKQIQKQYGLPYRKRIRTDKKGRVVLQIGIPCDKPVPKRKDQDRAGKQQRAKGKRARLCRNELGHTHTGTSVRRRE